MRDIVFGTPKKEGLYCRYTMLDHRCMHMGEQCNVKPSCTVKLTLLFESYPSSNELTLEDWQKKSLLPPENSFQQIRSCK